MKDRLTTSEEPVEVKEETKTLSDEYTNEETIDYDALDFSYLSADNYHVVDPLIGMNGITPYQFLEVDN